MHALSAARRHWRPTHDTHTLFVTRVAICTEDYREASEEAAVFALAALPPVFSSVGGPPTASLTMTALDT